MKEETYEEAVERIKRENDELIRSQWVGMMAMAISVLNFILIVRLGR